MGLREARKYISDLRRKQGNPYLWPDYVTGLPDSRAIVKKTGEVYPRLGTYAISLIRVANIHPYLLKYGSNHHTDVIQWVAAVLKTTMENYRGFVGALGSYDFVAICRASRMPQFLDEASDLFDRKAKSFYSKDDVRKGTVLSFLKNGQQVDIGLMRLVTATANGTTSIPREELIPHLAKACSKLEKA